MQATLDQIDNIVRPALWNYIAAERALDQAIPHEEYLDDLLRKDEWIIDGFRSFFMGAVFQGGCSNLHRSLITHHWWVTKRLISWLLVTPESWPQDSPIWSSTINSYKVLCVVIVV